MNEQTYAEVCHNCASGIVNDDWTWLDHHGGYDGDALPAPITDFVERGWWTYAGPGRTTIGNEGSVRVTDYDSDDWGYDEPRCECCMNDIARALVVLSSSEEDS